MRAASASALPWPNRCSASAGIAAQRTPKKVTRLAMRSSAVSARLPSMATDPVSMLAQTFSATRNKAMETLAMAARRVRLPRSAPCARSG